MIVERRDGAATLTPTLPESGGPLHIGKALNVITGRAVPVIILGVEPNSEGCAYFPGGVLPGYPMGVTLPGATLTLNEARAYAECILQFCLETDPGDGG